VRASSIAFPFGPRASLLFHHLHTTKRAFVVILEPFEDAFLVEPVFATLFLLVFARCLFVLRFHSCYNVTHCVGFQTYTAAFLIGTLGFFVAAEYRNRWWGITRQE